MQKDRGVCVFCAAVEDEKFAKIAHGVIEALSELESPWQCFQGSMAHGSCTHFGTFAHFQPHVYALDISECCVSFLTNLMNLMRTADYNA